VQFFIVAVVYLFVVFFDFLPVLKSGVKKECWVYCVFLCISFCVIILYLLDVKIPSPSALIKKCVEIFIKV